MKTIRQTVETAYAIHAEIETDEALREYVGHCYATGDAHFVAVARIVERLHGRRSGGR